MYSGYIRTCVRRGLNGEVERSGWGWKDVNLQRGL